MEKNNSFEPIQKLTDTLYLVQVQPTDMENYAQQEAFYLASLKHKEEMLNEYKTPCGCQEKTHAHAHAPEALDKNDSLKLGFWLGVLLVSALLFLLVPIYPNPTKS